MTTDDPRPVVLKDSALKREQKKQGSSRQPENKLIKCSVKKFVDFTCRSGDLEGFGAAGPTAAEGQKAHKILQSRKSDGEKSEVKVECTIHALARKLKLSGRIDLLKADSTAVRVSEIKSCYAPPHKLPQGKVAVHWAQLKVYGYCVLKELQDKPDNNFSSVTLQLVWYNLIADEVTIDEQVFKFDELQSFIKNAAIKYIEWIDLIDKQFSHTVDTAKQLEFPFGEFRKGQRDMAAAVYLGARDGFHVMCEAPTGIGKTISALFPAIKAIGSGDIERVIYLTAKNSGRKSASDCIKKITGSGLKLSAITITSKKTSCHCSNGTCGRNATDGTCPLAIGFFDRLPQARLELIRSGVITPDAIDNAAHEFALCPFELTQQLLPWVQVVICDYNYVFDPLVRFSELTENTQKQLLLVDEAHNLPDRARSMYSASLDRREIKKAISDLDKKSLYTRQLQSLVRAIDRWSKENTQIETESAHQKPPKTISRAIKKCMQIINNGTINNDTETPPKMTESISEVGKAIFRYAVIEELYGDHHRCITATQAHKKYKNTTVSLQCLNATNHLEKTYRQYRASVNFSATLRPQSFYLTSLGLPEDTRLLTIKSPFDPGQQCTLICDWVDTRYKSRAHSVNSIVEIIASVYFAKSGNYQVYFPSYAYMETVLSAFKNAHPSVIAISQERGSTEEQRQEFLLNFQQANDVLAFSIMGGVFGEGVDYTGNQLIGSIIVGTGLASINLTQQLIESDFKNNGRNGFDYASRYPGFTRVQQTAGRVIRSETDRGVVILVDQRFGQRFYQELFPPHWLTSVCSNLEAMEANLVSFWAR